MDLEIGMKAPNFSLNNHKDVNKINKNYEGKKLVIDNLEDEMIIS